MSLSTLLAALAPEAALTLVALFVLFLGVRKTGPSRAPAIVGLVGCFLAIGILFLVPTPVSLGGGAIVITRMTLLIKAVILLLSAGSFAIFLDTPVSRHRAEAVALMLFATVGLLVLAGTEDLLVLFASLELASLSLYALAGLEKTRRKSAEAALKYFLVGGVSAAFLLFGISLIFGVTHSTNLRTIGAFASQDPLFLVGMVMAIAGFAFKVAAVPFHLWAPDVYEGAPLPSAALVATGSKVAGFFVLIQLLQTGFPDAPQWPVLLAVLACASMILGNLAALVQSNVRRLAAYSAIAQGGYLLLGVALGASMSSLLYFLIVYVAGALGTFGVIAAVEKRRGGSRYEDFDGLFHSSPVLALALLVFFASFASIPPLAGFFGKAALFVSALENGGPSAVWLVGLALVLNAISLYYYLVVLRHALIAPPTDTVRSKALPASTLTVVAAALVIVVCGVFPNTLLRVIRAAETPARTAQSLPPR